MATSAFGQVAERFLLQNFFGHGAVSAPLAMPASSHSGASSPGSGSGSVDSILSDLLGCGEAELEAVLPCKPVTCPSCSSCDEGAAVVASCVTCRETLCEMCAQAHQRVRLTKDHRLVRQDDALIIRASLSESDAGAKALKMKIDEGQTLVEVIEAKAHKIAMDVRTLCNSFVTAVEERERELLGRLEKVTVMKRKSLHQQIEAVRGLLVRYTRLSDSLRESLQRCNGLDHLHMKEKAAVELAQLRAARANIMPHAGRLHEDDVLEFTKPDMGLLRAVASMGHINSSGFAATTVASGEGIVRAKMGELTTVVVHLKNHWGEVLTNSMEQLEALLIGPDGFATRLNVQDQFNGNHLVTYCPVVGGNHGLHVTLRGRHITGSPFPINVSANPTGPDYNLVRKATIAFGTEGNNDGQFLRPWGICTDIEGRIIVADRSNDRIQVFSKDGQYLYKFGQHGSQRGHFNRPAGVSTDTNNRIIVADKDNHRVQIFTSEGKFLLTFGEFGSMVGQFNYPWDVATNSQNEIVVSDTRNHRIQLFFPDGIFKSKYGFESFSPMWKHFDSPRGICFTKSGFICVTDFNNHRLLVVDPELRGARFLGREGSGNDQFQRPQGVTIDEFDRILVTDSRNNRIQVFEPSGVHVCEIGAPHLEMDRPSGICVTKEGKIAVVDFGNSRILVI